MEDKLINCPRCGGNACYESVEEDITHWMCFSCGFFSNSYRHKEKINYEDIEEVLPNLYKDLRFIDEKGYVWYPITINILYKGMVFVDGKSVDDWNWAGVCANVTDGKPDMATLNHFKERDFMEALDYINYFTQDLL